MATHTQTATQSSHCDTYLTLVPRGLHHLALDVIRRKLAEFEVVNLELIDEPVADEAEYCRQLQELLLNKSKKKKCAPSNKYTNMVGSVFDEERLKKHVSVGYKREICTSDDANGTEKTTSIWASPGVWEGSVLVKLETNAPAETIRDISVLGPLLACVHIWKLDGASKLNGTLEEAASVVRNLVQGNADYTFDQALDLWRNHAREWPENYKPPKEVVRYRVSCVRSHSKEFIHAREDFLKKVVDGIMLPQNDKGWKVNLKDYDVEVVILVPSPSCVAVGLTLRPYQLLNTNAFQRNVLPSDTSLPYISGHLTSGITRLRPTNAQLLLELADIQLGDIVLDPCAGIGTIPLNATTKKGVGIGGDLLMAPNDSGGPQERLASLEYMRQFGRSHPSTNLCAWDTGSLPIRSSSIDVIVSDLPFGKQCLSSSKLYMILPLWLGELARVLRPFGRIVLLCGAFGAVVDCMQDINRTGKNENWAITATFPVNIGGILAWIVMAQRTSSPTITVMNRQGRQRKLTANRDRNAKLRKFNAAQK